MLFRAPVEEQNDRKSKPEPASLQFRVPSEDKPASKPLPRNMEECEHMFGGLAMTAQDKEELLEFMRRRANRNAASATATPKASVQPPAAAGIEQQFTPLGGATTPDETLLESQSDAEPTLPSSQFCETKPAPIVPPRELEATALLPPPATPHTHFFPRTSATLAHAGSFATPAPRFLEFLQPACRSAAGLSQDPDPTPEQPVPTLMKDKELKAVSARAAAQAARKLKEVKSEQEDSDTVLSPEEQAKYQGWWSRYQKRSSEASLSEASLKRSKSSLSEASMASVGSVENLDDMSQDDSESQMATPSPDSKMPAVCSDQKGLMLDALLQSPETRAQLLEKLGIMPEHDQRGTKRALFPPAGNPCMEKLGPAAPTAPAPEARTPAERLLSQEALPPHAISPAMPQQAVPTPLPEKPHPKPLPPPSPKAPVPPPNFSASIGALEVPGQAPEVPGSAPEVNSSTHPKMWRNFGRFVLRNPQCTSLAKAWSLLDLLIIANSF